MADEASYTGGAYPSRTPDLASLMEVHVFTSVTSFQSYWDCDLKYTDIFV